MRQTFLMVETAEEAAEQAQWACKIVKVCGGYQAFESGDDYEIWNNQI